MQLNFLRTQDKETVGFPFIGSWIKTLLLDWIHHASYIYNLSIYCMVVKIDSTSFWLPVYSLQRVDENESTIIFIYPLKTADW